MSTPGTQRGPRKRLSGVERREVIEREASAVFAERGYHGASIEEIARRSGISPPVVYDHFESKVALFLRLLERTREELLAMWRENLTPEQSAAERFPAAFDAWARYIESHPFAPRMYFTESTGVEEIRVRHAEIQAEARAALAAITAGQAADAPADAVEIEMAAEVIRGGLGGLAVWWQDHPEVSREQIVATAMNVVWIGFERYREGQSWEPPDRG